MTDDAKDREGEMRLRERLGTKDQSQTSGSSGHKNLARHHGFAAAGFASNDHSVIRGERVEDGTHNFTAR